MSSDASSVSAVMCTYRGHAFVERQLATIVDQSRRPDELVIFDDASDDGTFELLEELAAKAPLPVHVHRQRARTGVASNFSDAIAAAKGDIIILSDQDDEWHRDRVEASVRTLVSGGYDLVFSDADVIDDRGGLVGRRLWRTIGFADAERRRATTEGWLPEVLRHNVMTGATMAFRATWKSLLLPIDPAGLHDVWIAVLLASAGRVAAIDEPLVRYRQHGHNQVGVRPRSPLRRLQQRNAAVARYGDQVAQFAALADRLRQSDLADEDVVAMVEEKVMHLRARAAIERGDGRVRRVIDELRTGRYARFSRGWESAVFDLVLRR